MYFERLCCAQLPEVLCGRVLAVPSGACIVCRVIDACCSPACMRACAESGGLCSRFLLEEEALQQAWPRYSPTQGNNAGSHMHVDYMPV